MCIQDHCLVDGIPNGKCLCGVSDGEGGVDCCRSFDLNGDRWNDLFISCTRGKSTTKYDVYGEVLYTGQDFCIRQNSMTQNLDRICNNLIACNQTYYS